MSEFNIRIFSDYIREIPVQKLLEFTNDWGSNTINRVQLHNIKFDDIQWSPDQEDTWRISAELRSLRNFIFMCRKQNVDALSVFAEWNQFNSYMKFFLEFDEELCERINAILKNMEHFHSTFYICIKVANNFEINHNDLLNEVYLDIDKNDDIADVALYKQDAFVGDVCTCCFDKLSDTVLESITDKERITFIWSVYLNLKEVDSHGVVSKVKAYPEKVLQDLYASLSSANLTIVASNGAEIKCHREILTCQNKLFETVLAENDRLNMERYSEKSIRMLVDFMYGQEIKPKDVVQLLRLAQRNHFNELAKQLQNLIRYLNRKLSKVHMEEYVRNISVKALSFSWKTTGNRRRLLVTNPPKVKINFNFILQALYDCRGLGDLTLVASNESRIKCHAGIFRSQSECFDSMLSIKTGMKEGKTKVIEMKQSSEKAIRLFVRFLYGLLASTDICDSDLAVEIIQLAHCYQVGELVWMLEDFLAQKIVTWYTVNSLVELYFFTKNVETMKDLNTHVLIEISNLSKETITSCDYFSELSKAGQEDLVQTFTLFKEKRSE